MKRYYVAIDNSNLYSDIRNNYDSNHRIQYEKLIEEILGSRDNNHMEVVLYVAVQENSESKVNFHHMLEYCGYRVKIISLVKKGDGWVEKGLDVSLAVDAIEAAFIGDYDTFILVAGDRDYFHLVEKLRELGKRTEVVFFKKSCAEELIRKAHSFTDLTNSVDRFLDSGKEE